MKLGISASLKHSTPEEWAKKHKGLGLEAVVFPCSYTQTTACIDEYVSAAKVYGLRIAEVGAWKNILDLDERKREENFSYCLRQLELADYVGADCCVNIAGAKGEVWDGGYAENYSRKTYAEIIESVQKLVDTVKPKKTFYTLEPMPWMVPDSPESYLQLIKDVDRERFAVHMDMVNMLNSPKKYLFNAEYSRSAFEQLGGYVKSCHVKDVILREKLTVRLEECPCGEGGFDIKAYIEAAEKVDFDMPMIIEHLCLEEEFLAAIAYIKKLMGGEQ